MPAGLTEQIDELDQLLDRLLKLPIESARPAPATIPMSPVTLTVVSESDDYTDDDSQHQLPILRFDEEPIEEPDKTEVAEHAEPPPPTLAAIPLPADPSPLPPDPSLSTPKLPIEEMPWLEDEPPVYTPGTGPQIEIIQGPTSQVIAAPGAAELIQSNIEANRRSWLHWILWTFTWCFDHTLGHWFPWLRRPGVKFLLGLVGVALCAVSLYLAWIHWQR